MYICNVIKMSNHQTLFLYINATPYSTLQFHPTKKKEMSSETALLNQKSLTLRRHSFRWRLRRRQQRLPTVRLGGKKSRRRFFVSRLRNKVKLKWLKLKYLSMLKKLKNYYKDLVKDMMQGSGANESYQQCMLLEASFGLGIPVMGVSFN